MDKLNRRFSEEVQMANKHRKKCSPSLAIKETQIKTKIPVHCSRIGNHQETKQQMLVRVQGWGWGEPSSNVGGNVN
jgi:hypothetical protein